MYQPSQSNADQLSAAEEKYKTALESIFGEVYKSHIRETQRQAHLCTAECCKKYETQQEISHCSDKCQQSLSNIVSKFQNEAESINKQLARCVTTCQDDERRKYDKEFMLLDPPEKQKFEQNFTKCTLACFEEPMRTMTQLKRRLINYATRD